MRVLDLFTLATLVALTTACASNDAGLAPRADTPLSTSITGKWQKDGLTKWEGHRLDTVDGKSVSFGFASNPYAVTVKVEPGQRKLVVLALFNIDRTQLSATIPMDVTLLPATDYRIGAAVSGAYIESWLEVVATGQKASDVFKGPCQKSVAEGMLFRKGPCTVTSQ